MKRLTRTLTLLLFATAAAHAQDYKAYQNYDFVSGEKILFEDDFLSDKDGEFPAHWRLVKGQAVVNTLKGERVFSLTEGNYVEVTPRIKGDAYLGDAFTIELDFFPTAAGSAQFVLMLNNGSDTRNFTFGAEVTIANFASDLTGAFPGGADAFNDKWHHLALAFKGNQVKLYIDQHRLLVLPDAGGFRPQTVSLGGIASPDAPLIFKNPRVAAGAGMNLIDKLTKDGKIVTHGIQFDVNKSVVKSQSMGEIAEIVKLLQSNASLKLEVGGHTDSDGAAAANLALSQARADAVRKLLVDQGIDAARLKSVGFGASRPMVPNDTPEG
ncbi:MAG: OmpA family protein, partial [Gemmatimonadales bacterium]